MNVMLVISSLEFGGAERQVVQIANQLDKKHFDVHVVTLSECNPLADTLSNADSHLHIISKSSRFDITVAVRLARLCRALKIDICHAFLFDAEMATIAASFISRVPIVIMSERNADYKMRRLHRIGRKIGMWRANHCIANSKAGARYNMDLMSQPAEKYSVISNGIDTKLFSPSDKNVARWNLQLRAGTFIIGMVANFKQQKNYPMAIDVATLLIKKDSNIEFVFVGDAPYREEGNMRDAIIEDVRNRGLAENCHFILKTSTVSDIYNACDLTILPSFHEGTPNVALESMACGVPVVATDVSDNADFIESGQTGYLVPSGDVEQMTSIIAGLIDDRGRTQQIGVAARKKILASFSVSAMAAGVEAIYSRLLISAGS